MEVGGADSGVGGQLTSTQEVVSRLPHFSWRPALLCDEMLPERFTLLSDQVAVDSPLLLPRTGVRRQATGQMVCGGVLTCVAVEYRVQLRLVQLSSANALTSVSATSRLSAD